MHVGDAPDHERRASSRYRTNTLQRLQERYLYNLRIIQQTPPLAPLIIEDDELHVIAFRLVKIRQYDELQGMTMCEVMGKNHNSVYTEYIKREVTVAKKYTEPLRWM